MQIQSEASVAIGKIDYQVTINAQNHEIIGDEPIDHGGGNTGMNPYQFFLASLGSCTVITLKMYIKRKEWPIQNITVHLSLDSEGGNTTITRNIVFEDGIPEAQITRLLEVADACPVHRMLTGKINIITN